MSHVLIIAAVCVAFCAVAGLALWLGCRAINPPTRPAFKLGRPRHRRMSRWAVNRAWRKSLPLWRAQMKPIADRVMAAYQDNIAAMPELDPKWSDWP